METVSLEALRERLRAPARWDVVGLGEASADEVWLVDEAPAWGGKARGRERISLGGGQVATALVALRRLGHSACWIGKLGDDAAGREVAAGLASEGVEVRVKIVRGAASHAAAIVVDRRGNRTVIWTADGRAAMTADDVDAALVCAGRVLHVDGVDLEASTVAAAAARAAGRVVSCDLDRFEPPTPALLALTDVCITSAEFLPAATGESDPVRAVRVLAQRAPRAAVVGATLGPEGAIAWDRAAGQVVRAPAFGGLPVVDTTACGDTFRAGLLTALLDGRDLGGALAFANAAAGLKARDLGRRGCPTRAEVQSLLDHSGQHGQRAAPDPAPAPGAARR